MMEFLDKIYGYEYFGIMLFAAIGLLLVLFLIVLFFGKKDEKKRELERTQKLAQEQISTEAFANTSPEASPVEVNAPLFAPVEEITENIVSASPVSPIEPVMPEIPVVEPTPAVSVEPVAPVIPDAPIIPEAPVVPVEPVAPVLEPVVEPAIVVPVSPVVPLEPVSVPEINIPSAPEKPEPQIEIPNFNFEELAASIANELNALENQNKPALEEVVVPKPTETIMPNIQIDPVQVPVTPINEVVTPVSQKPTPGPVTFSSVYINKPVEPVTKVEETVVRPVPEIVPPVIENQEQSIELPKPAEMPALNNNVVEEPSNNIPNAIPDFSQFEGESYDIK